MSLQGKLNVARRDTDIKDALGGTPSLSLSLSFPPTPFYKTRLPIDRSAPAAVRLEGHSLSPSSKSCACLRAGPRDFSPSSVIFSRPGQEFHHKDNRTLFRRPG